MDKLRFDFTFDHLEYSRDFIDVNKLSLWIFHIDKIPPHVGLSQQGIFFSLKSNGRDEVPTKKLIQIVENKYIKCIILNLKNNTGVDDIRKVFNKYERAFSSTISCLTPIKEVLNISDRASKLSELLTVLNERNLLSTYCSYNVTQSELGILKYEVSDIDHRLNLLHA